ncbi:hypothetical protein OPT61_g1962 [Boeremia exigua]|uniref:Uncharacterized protein n=1 Tax=Boeremia exigua TaxID=749465 RepID=A0ACC2IN74_9PLEO|nr:hypothetical protein OPT61_g1962 [Boeremia exigua]
MAYYRIGRSDDHHSSPKETLKDDEDEGPEETSTTFSSQQPPETPITPPPGIPAIPTEIPSSISYTSKMTDWPPEFISDKGSRFSSRPTIPPFDRSSSYDDYVHSHTSEPTTFTTTTLGSSSLQSTSETATLTRSYDDATSPAPTEDDISEIQNPGPGNGPNRGPMYAAAGIGPVLVIVIGVILFFCLRKRKRQRQAAAERGHIEEMKMHPKPVALPYLAPITPPSPPPAALPQYSPSTPSSRHPPTASSSQPVILGPIPSGNNGAYLTGIDTSDLVSMTSAGGISRQGTVVDRDPFADGRSLEEAPPPYRPSSLPPASIASTSRNNSVRMAAPARMTSRTQFLERSPFEDPEDDEISEVSGPTMGQSTDAMSDVSDLSYQVDPVVDRQPFR